MRHLTLGMFHSEIFTGKQEKQFAHFREEKSSFSTQFLSVFFHPRGLSPASGVHHLTARVSLTNTCNGKHNFLPFCLQDEKNQLMTTNVWLWQVTMRASPQWTGAVFTSVVFHVCNTMNYKQRGTLWTHHTNGSDFFLDVLPPATNVCIIIINVIF